jgi:hypothetical protein
VDQIDGMDTPDRWAAEHARLTARLRLVHERPWASVWRGETTSGPVWLKACAPTQAFEAALTAKLADRWPDLLPVVLAAEPERGLLLLADAGDPLGFDAGAAAWIPILPRYAELQRAEAAAEDHVLAGVPDRRVQRFAERYRDALDRDLPMSAAERARLEAFAQVFERLCDELSEAGPPATVEHADLHGGNVYPRDGTGRILDWGDAAISHPFLTLFVTLIHLPDSGDTSEDEAARRRLVDAYLEAWGSPADRREAMRIAARIGPFAHLFKELDVGDLAAPSQASFAPDLRPVLERCLAAVE